MSQVSSDSVCLSDMSLSSQLLWVYRDRIRPKPAAPATIEAIALKAYGGVESAGASVCVAFERTRPRHARLHRSSIDFAETAKRLPFFIMRLRIR